MIVIGIAGENALAAAALGVTFADGGLGETPVVINIRDYEQYNWKNFFHGNAAVASVTAVFPAAQPMK